MAGKTGVARLALTTRAPVIPVAQWGAQNLLARYAKLLKPFPRKKVTVVAGPPVDLDDLYGRPQDTRRCARPPSASWTRSPALLEEIRGEEAPAIRYDMRKPLAQGEKRVGGDHATHPELP